jgi:hypothetical protein
VSEREVIDGGITVGAERVRSQSWGWGWRLRQFGQRMDGQIRKGGSLVKAARVGSSSLPRCSSISYAHHTHRIKAPHTGRHKYPLLLGMAQTIGDFNSPLLPPFVRCALLCSVFLRTVSIGPKSKSEGQRQQQRAQSGRSSQSHNGTRHDHTYRSNTHNNNATNPYVGG